MSENALPYQEPGVVTLLIQSSLLLALNIVGHLLDKLIYCGLVGQIFVGLAWGTPGASWLKRTSENVVVEFGYLGLILLVFEGGLSTSIPALKSHLALSIAVAATGICLPIGLSFVLSALSNATPLQAFAAGSALCSTSLGTTFTVLKTSGLAASRLGVVLTSAAMLDDVVGLVMVQVISNLEPRQTSFDATTVIKPIGVSIAFATFIPLFCKVAIKPTVVWSRKHELAGKLPTQFTSVHKTGVRFLIYTATLIGFVAGASYAGTSNLFAAYLAGVSITWYDSMKGDSLELRIHQETSLQALSSPGIRRHCAPDAGVSQTENDNHNMLDTSGADTVSTDRHAVASSSDTPGTPAKSQGLKDRQKMITPESVGTTENTTATDEPKACPDESKTAPRGRDSAPKADLAVTGKMIYDLYYAKIVDSIFIPLFFASIGFSIPMSQLFKPSILWRGTVYALFMAFAKLVCGLWLVRFSQRQAEPAANAQAQEKRWLEFLPRPKSLYPASLLGCAMIARGEIGFLISAVAEGSGVFRDEHAQSGSASETSEIFLVVTWAILLCTVAGPLAVGLLTWRVKRLQMTERASAGGAEDPLGIWGIM